ncbi:MAG: hypothetical protein GY696_37715, partial [Gammaproteobacteria bacterium]|nr:hypothetical protein [Gammaproteobacteria bacterium]
MLASVLISENLEYAISVHGKPIRLDQFRHLTQEGGRFCHFSEVANVLSSLKNLVTEGTPDWFGMAQDCLDYYLESCDPGCDEDLEESIDRIRFLREQMKLAFRKPGGRRYSPLLLTAAYLIHASSPQVRFPPTVFTLIHQTLTKEPKNNTGFIFAIGRGMRQNTQKFQNATQ